MFHPKISKYPKQDTFQAISLASGLWRTCAANIFQVHQKLALCVLIQKFYCLGLIVAPTNLNNFVYIYLFTGDFITATVGFWAGN